MPAAGNQQKSRSAELSLFSNCQGARKCSIGTIAQGAELRRQGWEIEFDSGAMQLLTRKGVILISISPRSI